MPYKPTGRPPGRPRKNPDPVAPVAAPEPVERDGAYSGDLPPAAVEYIERRAVIIGVTPTEVIVKALREYAQQHPLPPRT